jgi:phosphoribosylformylglycinamidine cyclo-ligase
MLPKGTKAFIDGRSWPRAEVFRWLQEHGAVAEAEMHRVFNCGIGLVLAVSARNAPRAIVQLSALGETVYRIGSIAKGKGEPEAVIS